MRLRHNKTTNIACALSMHESSRAYNALLLKSFLPSDYIINTGSSIAFTHDWRKNVVKETKINSC